MADVLIFHANREPELRRSVHTPDYENRIGVDCAIVKHFDARRVAALPERVARKHLALDRGSVREMTTEEKAAVAAREQAYVEAAAREAAIQTEIRKVAEERLAAKG